MPDYLTYSSGPHFHDLSPLITRVLWYETPAGSVLTITFTRTPEAAHAVAGLATLESARFVWGPRGRAQGAERWTGEMEIKSVSQTVVVAAGEKPEVGRFGG